MQEIDDYHQAVHPNNQKILFNLTGLDIYNKQHKLLFKNKQELIDSIKILYKKCETDNLILDKHIEQTIRFFKSNTNNDGLYCRTLIFNNGRQITQTSSLWNFISVINSSDISISSALPYEIQLIEMLNCEEQSINDSSMMISELTLKILIKGTCWSGYLSIVLAKQWGSFTVNTLRQNYFGITERHQSKSLNIHKLKEIKAKLLNSEFTTDNFVNKVPYEYADVIKIQLEFNSFAQTKKYFMKSHIHDATKFLENSLIDTCRIAPQDIYMKVATILKIPNESKYKSGDFGIKQLTSRVITLDHDILHRELIPCFNSYAVAEKTDGITSIVLLLGKELFITCGTIVYKFDVLNTPTLPQSKNIELLKLNKIDLNNTWIFDSEVIIGSDGHLILIPFDIRMASSINLDNINFKYRLMFINGLIDLKVNKVTIKIKKWYKASDIKLLYDNVKKTHKTIKGSVSDGFIFSYLDSLNFTISMYYSSKVWKWKPAITEDIYDNNTIDFLIQQCPDTLKGKFPYIAGGKTLYVLCSGLSKSTHQSLPNITIVQSLIPNTANEYIPALFSPSDRPYSHLYWSENITLHGEVGEFVWSASTQQWTLLKIRTDRRIEVERGNYFGNDHKTAENNWFMMNNTLSINEITNNGPTYINIYASKHKFISAIYDSIVKHLLTNNETILNISPITIMEPFHKFPAVVYVYKNRIEANRYVKERYELSKKKIRLNSYYVLINNIKNIKSTIQNASIPISTNGFDNLILMYSIMSDNDIPGFKSLSDGMNTVKIYENLITKNGKIIIVIRENDELPNIIKAFDVCGYRKSSDVSLNQWVYITDNDLYDNTRILSFTKAVPTDLVNFVLHVAGNKY